MDLKDLEAFFKIFPGIGPRTAKRYIRVFLDLSVEERKRWIEVLEFFSQKEFWCPECGNFSLNNLCPICSDSKRKRDIICIVEKVEDIEILEKLGIFKGLYYVLGGKVNLLDKEKQDKIFEKLAQLEKRISKYEVKEIIFSLKLDVEGKITINFLKEKLREKFPPLKFTTLNYGLPPTLDLSLADTPTLLESFLQRKEI